MMSKYRDQMSKKCSAAVLRATASWKDRAKLCRMPADLGHTQHSSAMQVLYCTFLQLYFGEGVGRQLRMRYFPYPSGM